MTQFERTAILLGNDNMNKLSAAKVIVFGIGGVGGYVVEALARTGLGALCLVDDDVVSESNINRQIIALHSTVGEAKVEVAKKRCLDINPDIDVETRKVFYSPETTEQFNLSDYDYVVDAIDTVTGKLQLIEAAKEAGVPIISSMGAGNKMDATAFEVADIYETSVCPLAKVMRKELKDRGIKSLKVVYSKEAPISVVADEENGRHAPGSNAFVPSTVGLIIAGEVIKDLCK